MFPGKAPTNGIDVPHGMMDMPRYTSHKTVWALQIESVKDLGTDTTTEENPIVEITFKDSAFAAQKFNLRSKPTPEPGWYLVQYADGYTSFSPAKQFEEGNKLKPVTFKDRVVAERDELTEKLGKLNPFIGGEIYNGLPSDERERLSLQAGIMKDYLDILNERIAAF